jgi:hypothetical protein
MTEAMYKGDGPLAVAERQRLLEEAEAERWQRLEAERPTTPEHVKLRPLAAHRIVGGHAVCDGDRERKCHWYPACDDHELWPCGCEYVAHDECWIVPWINASSLDDSCYDDALDRRDPETLGFPDGEIEWEWEGEFVLWNYAGESEASA